MGRIKKIMFRAAHYKRFQLWDMCVSMCRPRPTFDWELCMAKMWESVSAREMPIKDEQQQQAPALFNSRKNQIIRLHKNGMANAGSLTILRILQTKDNNIMSEKARQLDSIMCDKQQSLNIKALMEMEYAIQRHGFPFFALSLSLSLPFPHSPLILCLSSLFLPVSASVSFFFCAPLFPFLNLGKDRRQNSWMNFGLAAGQRT